MKSITRKPVILLAVMCLMLVILAGCGNKPVNNNAAGNGNSSSGAGSEATAAPQESAAATEGVPSATASHPVVTIEMDNGAVIKAELYPEVAPQYGQQLHFID